MRVITAICLIGSTIPLRAEEVAQTSIASSSETWISVIVSLLLVICAIFAIGWAYKRIQNGSFSSGQMIKVLSVTPVGQRERLMVVEVDKRTFLLGVTQNSINLLKELDIDIVADSIGSEVPSEFSKKLSELISRQKDEV